MAQRDLKRLGGAIETRRRELGITQAEFAERGGLALATVQRVESGKINPRAKTWKGLDQGAGWPLGTSQLISEGGPIPLHVSDQLTMGSHKTLDDWATEKSQPTEVHRLSGDANPETLVNAVADLVRVLGEDETKAYLASLVERTARQDTTRHRASGE